MKTSRVLSWIESRTSIGSVAGAILNKPVPPRLPWSYTLGSVALLLFAIQVATGIFLAVYYAPTPDHAHASIRFIEGSVLAGRWLRGLHHWGASFMVVAVLLHMGRAFLYGSYRKPREVTWLLGVGLLGIVLAFGLTGYLLPWDQKAYWATMVTLRIAGSMPLVGGPLALIGAGGERLGALTLTRFYAIHVLILPALAAGLVFLHVALVQRHGSSGPPSWKGDLKREGVPFHPTQTARDAIAMTVVFAALLVTAIVKGAPLGHVADPTDATYVPRPEWYFLGLFQLLKYFPGRLEVIGTVVIPGVVTALLLLLPLLDTGPSRDIGRRRVVLSFGLLIVIAAGGLTALGALDSGGSREPGWKSAKRVPFAAVAGPVLLKKRDCESCHRADGFGSGPPFGGVVNRDATWIRAHLSDPEYVAPGARDPDDPVSPSQASVILSYLDRLEEGPLPDPSPLERAQIDLVVRQGCFGCHRIDGAGGTMGPNLEGVANRRSKEWIVNYLPDPEAVNPKAKMRSYPDLTPAERDTLASYFMRFR